MSSLTAKDAKPDAKSAKVILASSLGVLGGSRSGPDCCNQQEDILGYAARRDEGVGGTGARRAGARDRRRCVRPVAGRCAAAAAAVRWRRPRRIGEAGAMQRSRPASAMSAQLAQRARPRRCSEGAGGELIARGGVADASAVRALRRRATSRARRRGCRAGGRSKRPSAKGGAASVPAQAAMARVPRGAGEGAASGAEGSSAVTPARCDRHGQAFCASPTTRARRFACGSSPTRRRLPARRSFRTGPDRGAPRPRRRRATAGGGSWRGAAAPRSRPQASRAAQFAPPVCGRTVICERRLAMPKLRSTAVTRNSSTS